MTEPQERDTQKQGAGKTRPGYDRVPMRLSGGEEVIIELPKEMSGRGWEHMLRLLSVLKEGYVQDTGSSAATTSKAVDRVDKAWSLDAETRVLLEHAEHGGVPAFVTDNLRRIAQGHGVEVSDGMTPNQIIEEIKRRVHA